MAELKKQGITGFKVIKYDVRRAKDSEKLRLILEADFDDISCGNFNMGDMQGALLLHRVGDTDVGLNLFMKSDEES